jgi:hypothetical protein
LFHGELCLKADRLQSQLKKVEEEITNHAQQVHYQLLHAPFQMIFNAFSVKE